MPNLNHRPRPLTRNGHFFNGIDNDTVIKKFEEMYDLDSLGHQTGRFMYRGRPIIASYAQEYSGYVFHVCDIDDAETIRVRYQNVPFKASESAPVSAITRLQQRVAKRTTESVRVLEESLKDPLLMSLIGVIGDKTTIDWYDYGIMNGNDPIVNKVEGYFHALGYELEHSMSSNWSNERTFLTIDRQYLEDQALLKKVMS